ncbi:hypothetical protein HDU91_000506 [Kappamyces sp. JEL0680]|nr:hypothetical protein HDU91_000506 [Kappamyces sp. JEL0680]
MSANATPPQPSLSSAPERLEMTLERPEDDSQPNQGLPAGSPRRPPEQPTAAYQNSWTYHYRIGGIYFAEVYASLTPLAKYLFLFRFYFLCLQIIWVLIMIGLEFKNLKDATSIAVTTVFMGWFVLGKPVPLTVACIASQCPYYFCIGQPHFDIEENILREQRKRKVYSEQARIQALGASDELILSIPIFKFRPKVTPQPDLEAQTAEVDARSRQTSVDNLISAIPDPHQEIPLQTKIIDPGPSVSPAPPEKKRFKLFRFPVKKKTPASPAGSSTAPATPSSAKGDQYLELDVEDATCSICLCEYEADEQLRQLSCKHHYHVACIDEWLHRNGQCPNCRTRDLAPGSSTGPSSPAK